MSLTLQRCFQASVYSRRRGIIQAQWSSTSSLTEQSSCTSVPRFATHNLPREWALTFYPSMASNVRPLNVLVHAYIYIDEIKRCRTPGRGRYRRDCTSCSSSSGTLRTLHRFRRIRGRTRAGVCACSWCSGTATILYRKLWLGL
jgi:hypothetical protein